MYHITGTRDDIKALLKEIMFPKFEYQEITDNGDGTITIELFDDEGHPDNNIMLLIQVGPCSCNAMYSVGWIDADGMNFNEFDSYNLAYNEYLLHSIDNLYRYIASNGNERSELERDGNDSQ